MNINLANNLFNDGIFSEMYKAGFITDKIFVYREMYLWVEAQLKTRNISKHQTVLEAAGKFNQPRLTRTM
jgi:hypothetical protein